MDDVKDYTNEVDPISDPVDSGTVVDAKEQDKMKFIKRASELEVKYKQVLSAANATISTIKDIEDRLSKQKEALNLFNAELIKIDNEYNEIIKNIKE